MALRVCPLCLQPVRGGPEEMLSHMAEVHPERVAEAAAGDGGEEAEEEAE